MNIYELEKKATPGPWECGASWIGAKDYPLHNFVSGSQEPIYKTDAALLAHCHNNFMKALEALKRSSPICQHVENGELWRCPHWNRCETNTGDHTDPTCPALEDHMKLIAELEEVK